MHTTNGCGLIAQNLYLDKLGCSPIEDWDVCLPVEGQGGRSVEGVEARRGAQMRGEQLKLRGTQRSDFDIPRLGMGMSSLLLLVRSLVPLVGFSMEMGTLCMGGSPRDEETKRAEYRYPQAVQSASMSMAPPSSRPPIVLIDTAFCDKCLHVLRNDLPLGANLACSMQSAQARMLTPALTAQGLLMQGP